MLGLIRRSTYLSMMGLSFQSYRSTQSMTGHLLQMTSHAEQSQSLTSQSTTDQTLANDLHQESLTQQTEAQEIQDAAALLEKQAQQDELQSIKDQNDANSYAEKVKAETIEAQSLQAKIASEETLYESEIEKATSETSIASSNTLNTQSDTVATSFCEFVPFLDIVCDFVGGIAAVGFESNAAKLSAQSAIDYTSASTLKTQEETDLGELENLSTAIGENQELIDGLEAKANEEEMKSQDETTQAKEELEEASTRESTAQQDELESNEANMKAKEEYTAAQEEMDKSAQQGLYALKDAIVSGVISALVASFFAIRVFVAIVIPGTSAVISFVPYVITMPSSNGSNNNDISRQLWTALPRRETSYFILHCGIFISTMSSWFTSRFQQLNIYDVRSRGGILVMFAFVASSLQGFLLHVLPYLIMNVKKKMSESSSLSSSSSSSPSSSANITTSSSPTLWLIIGRSIRKLLMAVLRLTPLFIIETTTLWLIFGETVLSFHLPKPFTPNNVGMGLFVMAIIYVVVFELTSDDDGEANELITVVPPEKDTPSLSSNISSYVGEQEVDVIVIHQGDDDEGMSFMNETRSLLSNDYNQRISYNDETNNNNVCDDNDCTIRPASSTTSHNLDKIEKASSQVEIELSPPGEDIKVIEESSSACGGASSVLSSKVSMEDEGFHGEEHYHQQQILHQGDGISGLSTSTYQHSMAINNNRDIEQSENEDRSTLDFESVPLTLSSQQNSSAHQAQFSSDGIAISIVQSEAISHKATKTRAANEQTNNSYRVLIQNEIEEYIADLKLPFEILIMTCMIVLLQGSVPILFQLLPRVINSHKLFFVELSAIALVIGVILYYLVQTNNSHGHIGLWTGHSLRR